MKVLLSDKENKLTVYEVSTLYEDSYTVEGVDEFGNKGAELLEVPWALIGTTTSGDEFVVIMPKESTEESLVSAFRGDLDLRLYSTVTFYNPDETDVEEMRVAVQYVFR